MGRPVKCRICGKSIDKDVAYRAVTIGPKSGKEVIKYCCSFEEWQAEEDRKRKYQEDKDRVYYFICDIFGYKILNTKLFDEWALWNQLASNEVIYKYLKESENYLRDVLNQEFKSEGRRILYLSNIMKNNLHDFNTRAVNEEKKVQPKVVIDNSFELFEPTLNVQSERTMLDDVEDDLI